MNEDSRRGQRMADDFRRGYSEPRRSGSMREPGWERSVIEKLATESIKEQRRGRRWGIFFKLLGFAYVATALLLAFGKGLFNSPFGEVEPHTAIVDVNGVIAAGKEASADRIIAGVKAAFEDSNTAGIILRINSYTNMIIFKNVV